METLHLSVPSLANLLAMVEAQPGGYRQLFRGQANVSWGLTPSLYRVHGISQHAFSRETGYRIIEKELIDTFFREGIPYLPLMTRSMTNDRILAQHYGVPTSLLDWTRDPLVAAFFATESWQDECDAALFMILPDKEHAGEDMKNILLYKVIALVPPAIDLRIPAQKSVFTFHPYGQEGKPFIPLNEREDIKNLVCIVIPGRLKGQIHQSLRKMGVDRKRLFPGLDGIGADLTTRARSFHLW